MKEFGPEGWCTSLAPLGSANALRSRRDFVVHYSVIHFKSLANEWRKAKTCSGGVEILTNIYNVKDGK